MTDISQLLTAQTAAQFAKMTARNFHYYVQKGLGPPAHIVGRRKMYVTYEVTQWNNGLKRRQPKKVNKELRTRDE